MSTLEIIKMLCEKKGISIQRLEKELGFSNGSIAKNESMKANRLLEIAKYFNVSMEYLMGSAGYEFNEETKTWENADENYYFYDEAKQYAQFLYDNPEHRVLFDAARNVKPEDLQRALKAIGIFIDD